MSDFDCVTSGAQRGIKLGYLVQGNHAHPFSLTLHDLTNLFVIGKRAQDIYYNILLQLCNVHQILPIIITPHHFGGFEDQICEYPIWRLDIATDHFSFNPLNLGKTSLLSRQVTLLVNLFNQYYSLSPSAQNLLHVVIWQTIFSTFSPSFQALRNLLPNYRHHGKSYNELCMLLDALPLANLQSNMDNVSLTQLARLPTIITGPNCRFTSFLFNLLLLKLLSNQEDYLPPLFMLDPSMIEPSLFRWLCSRYLEAEGLLVIFNSHRAFPQFEPQFSQNLILITPQDEASSVLVNELTKNEQFLFQTHDDLALVKLRRKPTTQIITLF